jgi:hypothetical protein
LKIHFARLVKDSSPELISDELQKALRPWAWEIWKNETCLVAVGVGSSDRFINLSDRCSFRIEQAQTSTIIDVTLEYEPIWLTPVEEQDKKQQSRIEHILDKVCETLHCECERHAAEDHDRRHTPIEVATLTTDHPVKIEPESEPIGLKSKSPSLHPRLPSSEEQIEYREPFRPRDRDTASLFSAYRVPVGIISVSVLGIALCFLIWKTGHNLKPLAGKSQVQALNAATNNVPPSELPEAGLQDHPPRIEVAPESSKSPDKDQNVTKHSADVAIWLDEWASSIRTRDVDLQTSFYGKRVSPYLDQGTVSHSVVRENKAKSISRRKGLWAFKIEQISIRREDSATVFVDLTKHYMEKSDSTLVAERKVPTHLVLKRFAGSWVIVEEIDSAPQSARTDSQSAITDN